MFSEVPWEGRHLHGKFHLAVGCCVCLSRKSNSGLTGCRILGWKLVSFRNLCTFSLLLSCITAKRHKILISDLLWSDFFLVLEIFKVFTQFLMFWNIEPMGFRGILFFVLCAKQTLSSGKDCATDPCPPHPYPAMSFWYFHLSFVRFCITYNFVLINLGDQVRCGAWL